MIGDFCAAAQAQRAADYILRVHVTLFNEERRMYFGRT
jgi:hypothetical protein